MFNMFGRAAVNDNTELCIRDESHDVFGVFIILLKRVHIDISTQDVLNLVQLKSVGTS